MTSKQFLTLSPPSAYRAAYQEAGSGSPIVFLHGFMGDSSNWQFLVSLLQSHHRCISFDLLGFGDSSKPQIRYDIAQQVEFLDQAIAALGLENVAIVGHSLGGWVASAYAIAHPDRVRALVLVAPAGIRDDSFCGRYDHLRPLLWQTPIVDWALNLAEPIAPLLKQEKSLNQIRWIRRELNAQPAARSFLVDRLRPEDAIDTVEKEIHQLRVPTLVIAGEQDETIPLWHCQTYAREIPNAQLEILPQADHALPQKNSEAIATCVEPFLTSLEPGHPRTDARSRVSTDP